MSNSYYELELNAEDIATGNHRKLVGGHWDLIGKLQFEYLKAAGLKPEMKLLDVGCGRFYATIFECLPGLALEKTVVAEEGWSTYCDQDWYHYRPADMAFCAAEAPWDFEFIGDWSHPRRQKLCLFVRK